MRPIADVRNLPPQMNVLGPDLRPPPSQRRFTSITVERTLAEIASTIADFELAWLFRNCLPNTLDTTVALSRDTDGHPDTYIITGDIDAMWLRDSTAQVWPYLALADRDVALRELLAGTIRRQTRCILLDPYANAFYATARLGEWKDDRTAMVPGIHERKWELDSLAYTLRLAHGYWRATGDTTPFDEEWLRSVSLVLATIRTEQAGAYDTPGSPYRFRRLCDFGDSLANAGRGDPSRRCGLVRSAFRPSDDLCKFPHLVPSNAMMSVALRDLARLLDAVAQPAFAIEARALTGEINAALEIHAVVSHPQHGEIWAYEVDGFGSLHLMDDANVPSLLALPYFGFCAKDDPRYLRTRAFCLSANNPYFAAGRAGAGIGSPHTGLGTIWPIALAMQALTATDDAEILQCLRTLKATHAGTGFMHESFDRNDATRFTRPWFAWANTLFGELILTIHRERPHLLARPL